jgi:hypothetical protein
MPLPQKVASTPARPADPKRNNTPAPRRSPRLCTQSSDGESSDKKGGRPVRRKLLKNLESVEEETEPADSDRIPSSDEDYRKWKKIDLIKDLIYYRDRDRELSSSIVAMKNAWKDEEKLMNDERMGFEIQKNNWKVDMHNQKARLHNEYLCETEKLFEKMALLKQSVKEEEKQVAELRGEQAASISAAIETQKVEFEIKLEDAAAQNDELLSEVQLLKIKNQNLEIASREHESKMENKSAELRHVRSALAQFNLKLASKEDELLSAKTDRMSIDPLDSNDTIDFDKLPPPTHRSSILPPRRTILNSTEELMSNIVEENSKTTMEVVFSFENTIQSDLVCMRR